MMRLLLSECVLSRPYWTVKFVYTISWISYCTRHCYAATLISTLDQCHLQLKCVHLFMRILSVTFMMVSLNTLELIGLKYSYLTDID